MTINISSYCPQESTCFHIEYWYNRHERSWVVQVYDDLDRQQESSYCPDKEWRDGQIKDYAAQYRTDDIRKV